MDLSHYNQQPLPYGDPQFDYGNYLTGSGAGLPFPSPSQSLQLSASDSSPGHATPPSSDSKSPSASSGSAVVRRSPAQRQRLERRGHTKSRRGCYNCKRRRIKCQETHPACGHCVKTGLNCEYPNEPQITHQPHHQIPLFSLQDMRFFQHFLTQCYPRHPLKQEEVWTHDIPCIAHNHEYLMHAILGYAASELIHTDSSLVTAAMNHRIKAIKAIKKRLSEASKVETNYEEANALVATCFALTFQSVLLDDGLAEYMTFIRGILVVALQMAFRGIKPIFPTLFEDEQNKLLAPYMEDLPLIQRGVADTAVEAIRNLRPLCSTQVEIEYQEHIMAVAETLYVNSFDAYKRNSKQYGWFMMLPHGTFQELVDMDNQVILLLHTHWIGLSQIMDFINEQQNMVREKHPSQPENQMDPGFLRWLRYLNARIDHRHQAYNSWPVWVDEQLERDITVFGRRA